MEEKHEVEEPYLRALRELKARIGPGRAHASANQLAESLHMSASSKTTLYNALAERSTPKADTFLSWLNFLGARIVWPDEDVTTTRQVCFGDVKIVQTAPGAGAPSSEHYLAVPLASGSVAAKRGLVPEEELRSWLLVWRHHESVRRRTNLLAVEIGRDQRAMIPTLHPGDIVLVDRNDFKGGFKPPGNIHLVREPDGATSVKRVIEQVRENDVLLTYYADNVAECPPQSYSLRHDFAAEIGEIGLAVIGRVVWAWTDMTKK